MADVRRWAIVDAEGVVDNVVLWDGDEDSWTPPEGFEAVELGEDDRVGPGHAREGGRFRAPERDDVVIGPDDARPS